MGYNLGWCQDHSCTNRNAADTSAWAKERLRDMGGHAQSQATRRDSVPKRSSWARAWRMREAPMRELIEAERAVA